MDLAGQILIAMPGMVDPRFDHSVILVCAHSAEGAMGIIINKPLEELTFAGLLEQLGIPEQALHLVALAGRGGREGTIEEGTDRLGGIQASSLSGSDMPRERPENPCRDEGG